MPSPIRARFQVRNPTSAFLASAGVREVAALSIGDRRFVFRRPLKVRQSREHGHFTETYEPFGMYVFGRTEREAMQRFATEFDHLWNLIALETDSKLHPSARRLKKKLFSSVESIEYTL